MLARRLGVTEATVANWEREGTLPRYEENLFLSIELGWPHPLLAAASDALSTARNR
jgi:hypothetical protein